MNIPVSPRQERVFRAVVREHVRTAEPVGSAAIYAKYRFGVSPATIRNDMADLETVGLLTHPHTSAGRVPTDSGYRFYVENIQAGGQETQLAAELDEMASALRQAAAAYRREAAAKDFARHLATLTGETVFLNMDDGRSYLAGLSQLARQPEFGEAGMLLGLSDLVDDFDRLFENVRRRLEQDLAVFIGNDNPFGAPFSTIIVRFSAPTVGAGAVGLLGPKRMDYDGNLVLMRHLRDILSTIE